MMWELNDKGLIEPTGFGGFLLTLWALIGVGAPTIYLIVQGILWCINHLAISQFLWGCVGVAWVMFAIIMLARIPWIRRSRLVRVNKVMAQSMERSR